MTLSHPTLNSVASHWPLGLWLWLRCAALTVLSRGFSGSPALAQPLWRSFIWVYSQQEAWVLFFLRPTGLLTARVLGNGGSAPRQVSVWGARVLSLVFVLVSRLPGTARLVSHRLVSAGPRAQAATRPLGHSLVFSHIRRKACLSR